MLGSDIVLVIAGNKIDLEHERMVPLDEAERYSGKLLQSFIMFLFYGM